MSKPWAGEFPIDSGLDGEAVAILVANMNAGRNVHHGTLRCQGGMCAKCDAETRASLATENS